MSKFSITDGILNGISKNVKKAEELQAKENFRIEYIDINNIIPNKENFYSIVDIEGLAEDIKINGLNHNLVVRKIKEEDKFEIISGERRYTAIKKLIEQGETKLNFVPCKIVDVNDIDSQIILIQANAKTRELTEKEKLEQVERLEKLYKEKKSKGEKVQNIRKEISKDLGLSTTQVGRYLTTNNNLIEPLKKLLEDEKLNITNASEFATLTKEMQEEIAKIIENKINLTKNEALELKKKYKKIEDEKKETIELEKDKIKQKSEIEKRKIMEEFNKKLDDTSKENKELQKRLEESNKKFNEKLKKAEEVIKQEYKDKIINLNNKYVDELKNKQELKKQLKSTDEKIKQNSEEIKNKFELNIINDNLNNFKEKIVNISKINGLEYELSQILNSLKEMQETIELKTNKIKIK